MRRHPHRLRSDDYRGCLRFFLTIPTKFRKPHFTEASVAESAVLELLRTGRRCQFEISAYCFMPDHLHALVEGISIESNLTEFVRLFKQRSGYAFRRRAQTTLWQPGYYDRTVHDDKSEAAIIRYIVNNPCAAGLVTQCEEYPFWGSGVCTRDELAEFVGWQFEPAGEGGPLDDTRTV